MPPAPWGSSGLAAGDFRAAKGDQPALWMDMALARRSGQELREFDIITNSPEYAPLRRFFKAAVDGFAAGVRPLPRDIGPAQVATHTDAEAVADCDDGSSDGSLMLLSPPHDIPEVTFPAGSSRDQETRDEVSPVVFLVG